MMNCRFMRELRAITAVNICYQFDSTSLSSLIRQPHQLSVKLCWPSATAKSNLFLNIS